MNKQLDIMDGLFEEENKIKKALKFNNWIARDLKFIETRIEAVLSYRDSLEGNFMALSHVQDRILTLKSILSFLSLAVDSKTRDKMYYTEKYKADYNSLAYSEDTRLEGIKETLKNIKKSFRRFYTTAFIPDFNIQVDTVDMFLYELDSCIKYIEDAV